MPDATEAWRTIGTQGVLGALVLLFGGVIVYLFTLLMASQKAQIEQGKLVASTLATVADALDDANTKRDESMRAHLDTTAALERLTVRTEERANDNKERQDRIIAKIEQGGRR